MYSAQVLEHFERPRNAGELPGATFAAQVENPVCGDVLKLWLKTADGKVTDARFQCRGCVSSVACGSMLTELLIGCNVAQAKAISQESLMEALGGLPEGSTHAAQLAMEALADALGRIAQR